tara:strand:- start:484 stop:1878 length:1395 start_codon:yes stop_codon:yes gene_type:complete
MMRHLKPLSRDQRCGKTWIGIGLLVLILNGCAGSNQWGEAPTWVNERPRISSDYIGIASASKNQFAADAFGTAQKRALAELAGQIRVTIETTSILHTTQFQGVAGQNFSENIKSVATEELEGYELMGRYENETEIWAYYRLNKATYQKILAERKAADMEIAGAHYESAIAAYKQGNVGMAIDGYLRCLEDLETHWGEINAWQGPSGEIALDRVALDSISRLVSDIHLEAERSEVVLSFADRYRGVLKCRAILNDQPLNKIPVVWSYKRGTLPKRDEGQTNPVGEVIIELSQFEPGTRRSELNILLNLDDLAPRIAQSPARKFLNHLPVSSLSVPIELSPPTIYFSTNEKVRGEKRDKQLLRNAIAEGLSNQGVTWVERKNDADLILTLEADTRDGGSGSGFFTAFLNASVVIKTTRGAPIVQQNLNDIKGIQLDLNTAHANAYEKAALEIKGKFLRQLINALYE